MSVTLILKFMSENVQFRHPAQRIPNELHGHFISVRYKGCADRWRWRGLDISYQGCRYQDYLGWNNRRTLWCFCDYEFCNRVRKTDFNDARFTKKGDSIQQDSKGQGGSREKDSYKKLWILYSRVRVRV